MDFENRKKLREKYREETGFMWKVPHPKFLLASEGYVMWLEDRLEKAESPATNPQQTQPAIAQLWERYSGIMPDDTLEKRACIANFVRYVEQQQAGA